jgi:hypothetical protein
MNPETRADNTSPTTSNPAVRYFEEAIASGKHWYIALLEAICLWQDDEENYRGRHYNYLIDGEAFDWLLAAERLCQAAYGLIPEGEKIALLFYGRAPFELSKDEFKELIGEARYKQHLNYFYGITVEEALFLAIKEEVRKEKRTSGSSKVQDFTDEVFARIYGSSKQELQTEFHHLKHRRQSKSTNLTEIKEFTYWLFKYRLKNSDKSRVASDTKKALGYLESNNGSVQTS